MIRALRTLLALPLLFSAPLAAAQMITPAAPMSALLRDRLATLPTTLMGLSREDSWSEGSQSAPMIAYRSRDAQAPVIAVILAAAPRTASWQSMAENGRAGPRQAGLIDTLFEGKFTLDGHPPSRNFFGDYLTRQGVKQSWIADIDGVRVTVLATIYRAEDRRRVFDAIRRDLLGGITMETLSIAEAN